MDKRIKEIKTHLALILASKWPLCVYYSSSGGVKH